MNPARELPPLEYLQECFSYNPETGLLSWRERPVHHFVSELAAIKFNNNHAGRETGTKAYHRQTKRPDKLVVGLSYKGEKRSISAHRIILALHGIQVPPNHVIDHRDGNAFNNRMDNLRHGTFQQNTMNNPGKRNPDHSPRILPKCVFEKRGKFTAKLTHNRKQHHIGTFNTPEEARSAWIAKAREIHGEFFRET